MVVRGQPEVLSLFGKQFQQLLPTVVDAISSSVQVEAAQETARPVEKSVAENNPIGTQTSCSTCGVTFTSSDDMRQHYKADWHRYNLQRKVAGRSPVSEAEFEEIEEVSSIDASDSDSESDDDDTASRKASGRQIERGSPYILLPLPDNKKALRLFRQIVSGEKRFAGLDRASVVKKLHDGDMRKTHWTLLMLGAGHFAGTVIDCASGKSVVQKTFHRYTTRRKQGGAQSKNDSAKGSAKSAGAMLRRYNEQALKDDIHDLLLQWRSEIEGSELIFIRSSVQNRRTLFFEDSPLSSADERIRSFPFTTRRPTHGELMRCFKELSTVTIEDIKEVEPATLAPPKPKAPVSGRSSPALQATSEPKAEEPALDPELVKLADLCKRGKIEVVQGFLQSKPTFDINAVLPDSAGTSFLYIASSNNHPELVAFLLDLGADPTKAAEKKSLRPYDAASSKETRDAFRRHMAKEPERWDWKEAHVPGPLTPEMEQQQKEKEKEKKKKAKEKQKAYNAAKKESASEPEPEPQKSSSSGRPLLAKLNKTEREMIGLTPEQRMALDREKRALAAEARIRGRMNQCAACGKSLSNCTPFEKFMYRYCSLGCVQAHSVLHSG
ncbi:uncharacterized protein EV422DRAFT_16843 [Fimicolochytrium jonesii]|uniref:uncharacterized protein n=1 Tax=Fimicolochytrium jonesii TaxID=1396493 RepID=UPI0022FF09DC|nr:uncharacterized protein EV422DRAFT_16843 [Fimicolochytrium jonesii]KAI8826907.1 hypothetical protein EV422DRAFT_16843 [Fimicolochytrium jonesii]